MRQAESVQATMSSAYPVLFVHSSGCGLEEMFFELAELPSGALTDPKIRAAVSARYDSIPS